METELIRAAVQKLKERDAEIERLTVDLRNMSENSQATYDENVRLRSALEAIANDADTNIEARAYARNTLAYVARP